MIWWIHLWKQLYGPQQIFTFGFVVVEVEETVIAVDVSVVVGKLVGKVSTVGVLLEMVSVWSVLKISGSVTKGCATKVVKSPISLVSARIVVTVIVISLIVAVKIIRAKYICNIIFYLVYSALLEHHGFAYF